MRNLGSFLWALVISAAIVAAPIIGIMTHDAHALESRIESHAGDYVVTGEADATSTQLHFNDGEVRTNPLTPIIGHLRFNDDLRRFEVSTDGKPFESLATHGELDRMEVAMQGLVWANESLTERQSALGIHFNVLLALLVVGFTGFACIVWMLLSRLDKIGDAYANLRRDVESLNRAVTPPVSQGQGPMRTPGDNRPPPTRVPSGGTPIQGGAKLIAMPAHLEVCGKTSAEEIAKALSRVPMIGVGDL